MEIKNNYIDAPDKYTNIEDFIREFTGENNEEYETNWGMDFEYNGESYHLSRYQMESNELRKKFEKQLGYSLNDYMYEVCINKKTKGNIFSFDGITIIGIYKDVYDLLENFKLDNKKFKEIIISDAICIKGKD